MPRSFCFEPNNWYVVSIRFQRHGVSHRHLTAFILIDSVRISLIYHYQSFIHMLLNALNKEYLWCNFLTTDNTSAAPCWWVKNAYSISLSSQLVLIPRYEELPGFQGDDGPDERRRQEMEVYMCLDSFTTLPMPALAELCTTLICSISAIMHDGALGESLWWGQRINVLTQCPVKKSHYNTSIPFSFR